MKGFIATTWKWLLLPPHKKIIINPKILKILNSKNSMSFASLSQNY
jgi:hypothetical protein